MFHLSDVFCLLYLSLSLASFSVTIAFNTFHAGSPPAKEFTVPKSCSATGAKIAQSIRPVLPF
jgi:hypothetical protein